MLYLCICGIVGFILVFWCDEGGMGSVSYGIMRGSLWGVGFVTRPGVSVMLTGGSTLGGGVGTSYGVAFGVPTLGGGVGASCRGSALVADGVSC